MALRKLVRRNYDGKSPVSIKYQNLLCVNEGVNLLCQSILETRRITHLHGSALFTIPLSYRIDLYFHDYNLTIEIDENGHSDRSINYKIKRQKVIEQELGCKFTTIDPDKKDFDFFKTINEISRHSKQLTKKL